MTPGQAGWVREHAWTQTMRKEYREVPGYYTSCACQYGASNWCQMGQCGQCRRADPLDVYATAVVRRKGHPAFFAEPFQHPTRDACGPKHSRTAMVWLADRVCRWVCPCRCHAMPAAPVQLGLFAEVA